MAFDMFQDQDMYSWVSERYDISFSRIADMAREGSGLQAEDSRDEKLSAVMDFFEKTASFINMTGRVYAMSRSGEYAALDENELSKINAGLYADIMPGAYETGFANPSYAVSRLGSNVGPLLSWLYTETRSLIPLLFRNRLPEMAAVQELFLLIYGEFSSGIPKRHTIRDDIYWYVSDYADKSIENAIRHRIDPDGSAYRDIIMNAGTDSVRYLYLYGKPVSESETQVWQHLEALDEEIVTHAARTLADECISALETAGADLNRRNIRIVMASSGYERVIRETVMRLETAGYRCILCVGERPDTDRNFGIHDYIFSTVFPQYCFDHEFDRGIYLDRALCANAVTLAETAWERCSSLASSFAGTVFIDDGMADVFIPSESEYRIRLSERQKDLEGQLLKKLDDIESDYLGTGSSVCTVSLRPDRV